MNGRTDWTAEKEEKFLKKLETTGGNVSAASRIAGIARSTAYEHKKQNEDFALAWDEAIEKGTDDLEEEARRRALKGLRKAIFYKGEVVGYEREYSDTLMIFLLKGNRPEKYKDRHELTGKDGAPMQIVPVSLDEWKAEQQKRREQAAKTAQMFSENVGNA